MAPGQTARVSRPYIAYIMLIRPESHPIKRDSPLQIPFTSCTFGDLTAHFFEMKLEKMVSDKIHFDTETEQSKKLRALLSLTEEQDELIEENRKKDVQQDEIILAIENYNLSQDKKLQEHKKHMEEMINKMDNSD